MANLKSVKALTPEQLEAQAERFIPGLIESNGKVVGNPHNISLMIRHKWEPGTLGYDEFANKVMLLKELPFDTPVKGIARQWTDQDDAQVAMWVARVHGIPSVPIEAVYHAVESEALHNSYHPVKEYLEKLQWDGTPRIDQWLQTYLGVEDSPYAQAVGSKWLISAVSRVTVPGCQADTMLVLEGEQGVGKSTVVRALIGTDWFSDDLADFKSKDSAMQLQGVWGLELAELDQLARAEVTNVKAFLTRQVDHYRPPYGRRVVDVKRSCVFVGTCNNYEWAKDETGNRRFWPVRCTYISVDAVSRDRDQLWAEALVRYRSGEQWFLTGEILEGAREEQAKRLPTESWQEKVDTFIAGKPVVSVDEILDQALFVPVERWNQTTKNKVAICLKRAGWVCKITRIPTLPQVVRRYFPPA